MDKLELKWLAAGDLAENPANWRTHPKGQTDAIKSVIADPEIGWAGACLYNERTKRLIDGHARRNAVDPSTLIPVLVGSWSEAAEKKILLTLDPLAGMAIANPDNLRALLDDVVLAGDLQAVGDELLKSLESVESDMARNLPVEEDESPEVGTIPTRCKPGDLWSLGNHRLLCGDSTSADDVTRLMGGDKAELMVTDPPYGVEYDADWRNHAFRSDGSAIAGKAIGTVTNDSRADWTDAWSLWDGDVAYVWHAGLYAGVVAESLIKSGLKLRSQIVWAKSNFAIGRGDYHWKHEPCWYAVRDGKTGHYNGDRTQSTLWEIAKPSKSETGHSTQKPVECMAIPIRNNSIAGGSVYDPFLGSGTTLIAAEQLGRKCYGMEISPQYCDVILARWEKLTGKTATKV